MNSSLQASKNHCQRVREGMDDLTCSKVSLAVAQCPFLQAVKEFQGEDYACRLAVNPFESATNPNSQPIFPEDVSASLRSVFTLFHGREGPMTLSSSKSLETGQLPPRCPMRSVAAAELSPQGIPPSQVVQPVAAGFPMASISLSGFNFFVSYIILQSFLLWQKNVAHSMPFKMTNRTRCPCSSTRSPILEIFSIGDLSMKIIRNAQDQNASPNVQAALLLKATLPVVPARSPPPHLAHLVRPAMALLPLPCPAAKVSVPCVASLNPSKAFSLL